MNVRTEDLPGCRIKISLEFESDEVSRAYDKIIDDLNTRGQVKGFRPGKAPRNLLVRFYGAESIDNSAKYELLESNLEGALEELDILGQPEVPGLEDVEIEEGKGLELELFAHVGPRVKLGQTEGLGLREINPAATEEEFDRVIQQLLESNIEEVEVERDAVSEGDAVDLELTVKLAEDDEIMEGIEQQIVVGEGEQFPPLGEKLPGKIVGQSVEMDVTYPDDYHDESLAGKEANIKAEIKALRERVKPELTDEFAQKLDEEKFSTVEDLKTEIRRQLDEERSSRSRRELENQIIKLLMENSEVEVPDVLVEQLAGQEIQALEAELSQMNMDIDTFREMTGVSPEDFEGSQLNRARHTLEMQAIIEELGKAFEDATDEEIEAEVETYARDENVDVNFVRQAAAIQPDFKDRMITRIRRRKVMDQIIEAAAVTPISLDEFEEIREELLTLKRDEGTPEDDSHDEASEAGEAVSAEESSTEDAPETDTSDEGDSDEGADE